MIGRLFSPAAATLRDPPRWLVNALGAYESHANIDINANAAHNYSAFYACVMVLSESIASLPFQIYRRIPSGGKERMPDHPYYRVLHNTPNPYMSAYTFFQTLQSHILTWGNAYAQKAEAFDGTPFLDIWHPERVTPMIAEGGKLVYECRTAGDSTYIPADMMLHVQGLSGEGILGYSPLRMHREAIGLGLAAEKFGAKWFGHGSRPSGILMHPKRMSAEGRTAFRDEWERNMGGDNQNKIAILEEGFQWQQLSVPPEEAQFLETRKFQVNEMARIHRIPPHMIGDLERSTNNNIEHQGIEFVVHTLRPWLVRWEQEIHRKLLGGDPNLIGEFLVDGLMRGDMASRLEAYATGLQNGIYSPNEVRSWENLNPYDGGDEYLTPLNMTPAPRGEMGAVSAVLTTAQERVASKEQKAVRNAAVKFLRCRDTEAFKDWASSFYDSLEVDAMQALEAPLNLHSSGGESAYMRVHVRCESALARMLTLCSSDDPERAVVSCLDEWSRGQWLTNTETS